MNDFNIRVRRIEDWLMNYVFVSLNAPKIPTKWRLWYHPVDRKLYIKVPRENMKGETWQLLFHGNIEELIEQLESNVEELTETMETLETAFNNHIEDTGIHREIISLTETLSTGSWVEEGDVWEYDLVVEDLGIDDDVIVTASGTRVNKLLYDVSYEIYAEQYEDLLVFSATDEPLENLEVNILIIKS